MSYTAEDFLLMKKEELAKTIRKATPKNPDPEYFKPNEVQPSLNLAFKDLKEAASAFRIRQKKVVKIQTFAIPAFIFLPTIALFLFKVDPRLTGSWFVFSLIAVIAYFTFVGKVTAFRSKRFAQHVVTADTETKNMVEFRAAEWARRRYVLPAGTIGWSAYGSEIRIGEDREKVYEWVEPIEDHYRLNDLATGEEAPLRNA